MRTDWRVEERLREKLALLSQELSETLAALDAVRADLAASEKAREEAERERGVLGDRGRGGEVSEIRTHEQVAGIIGILCEEVANDVEMGAEEHGDATRRTIEWLTAHDAALRAEVERLRKALRHSARELQYIADDDPCDKCHQSGEGRACVALAERILGPMHTWPDEPNLSAPAEEDGRDA